tara:strand:+ start:449 stop:1171 length:723 start_codon:yes stop_codon:yes gene_type:complete
MADISTELDRIAGIIAEKSNKAVEEVVNSLMELVQDKTGEEALEILSGINLKYAMESKMAGAFALYEQGVVSMLENMYSTSTLSGASLRALLDNSKRLLSTEFVDKMADNILQGTVRGISSGLTPSEVMESIGDITGTLETQVVTAFGQYSSAVTNLLSENLPDNTRFIYIGPYDSKTRQECVDRIQLGPVTRTQILKEFKHITGGDFNNAIWNCRHNWEQRSSSPEDQGYNPKKFVSAG